MATGSQKPCWSRQADEALSSTHVVYDKSRTYSWKTVKEVKAELV